MPSGGPVDIHHLDARLRRQQRVFQRHGRAVLFGWVGVHRHLATAFRDGHLIDQLQFIAGHRMAFARAGAADIDAKAGLDETIQESGIGPAVDADAPGGVRWLDVKAEDLVAPHEQFAM